MGEDVVQFEAGVTYRIEALLKASRGIAHQATRAEAEFEKHIAKVQCILGCAPVEAWVFAENMRAIGSSTAQVERALAQVSDVHAEAQRMVDQRRGWTIQRRWTAITPTARRLTGG